MRTVVLMATPPGDPGAVIATARLAIGTPASWKQRLLGRRHRVRPREAARILPISRDRKMGKYNLR